MLVRVDGTPLGDVAPEDPLELVRTIATARILMPASFVRLSAGRLSLTDEAQALCFLAGANSVFLGDRLLTTPNPGESHDEQLLDKLGMRLTPGDSRGTAQCRRITRSSARPRAPGRPRSSTGLLRTLRAARRASISRRTTTWGSRTHPRVKAALAAGVSAEGCGSTGRGCCAASATRFAAVEQRFAAVQGHRALAVFFVRAISPTSPC